MYCIHVLIILREKQHSIVVFMRLPFFPRGRGHMNLYLSLILVGAVSRSSLSCMHGSFVQIPWPTLFFCNGILNYYALSIV